MIARFGRTTNPNIHCPIKRPVSIGVQMEKKYGKFYADWRDEHGKRHRRAFKTAAEARAYQTAQLKRRDRKKAPASAQQ